MNVYIVDDDPAVRDALGRLLMMEGYAVRAFPSGKLFLDQIGGGEHGVAVLDWEHKGVDESAGRKTFAELKRRNSPLVVLFLSGEGTIPDATEVIKGGAVDWLVKPVDASKVLLAVEKACAKARARKEGWGLWATLTRAERELVSYLVTDLTARDIGNILGKDHRTVETQRSAVYNKLRVDGPGQLRKFMIEHDIPDDSKRRSGDGDPAP